MGSKSWGLLTLVIGLLAFGGTTNALAADHVVAAIGGEGNAARDAAHVTLILKSALGDTTSAARTKTLGEAFAGGDLAKAVAGTEAKFIVGGKASRRGGLLVVELATLDRRAQVQSSKRILAPLGDVRTLTRELHGYLRELTPSVLDTRIRVSSSSLEALTNAYVALAAGRPEEASVALQTAQPNVAMQLAGAKTISGELVAVTAMDVEERVLSALSVWDRAGAQELIDGAPVQRQPELQAIFDARVALVSADTKRAEVILRPFRRSGSLGIIRIRAEVAFRGESKKVVDESLRTLLAGETPSLATLGWVCGLPASALSTKSERLVFETAKKLGDEHIALRSSLLARASASGIDLGDALALISGLRVDQKKLEGLSMAVSERAKHDDMQALRVQTQLQQRSGDVDGAKASLAQAIKLDPENTALASALVELESSAIPLDISDPELAPAQETTSVALDDSAAALSKDLIDELNQLLTGFAGLNHPQTVAIVRLPSSGDPWYSLRTSDEHVLATGLAQAISLHKRSQAILSKTELTHLSESALVSQLQANDADAVLAYETHAKGGSASVSLVYFDATSREALTTEGTISAGLGLVVWSQVYVYALGLLLLVILILLVRLLLLGRGHLSVRIEMLSANEKLCIRLTRREAMPSLALRKNRRHSKYRSELVSRRNEFRNLIAGTWYVHVGGTYERGNEIITLPPSRTKVKIRRGQVTSVLVDLMPKTASLRVLLIDGERAISGAKVTVGETSGTTDAEGRLTVEIPVGRHQARIEAGTESWEVRVDAPEPAVCSMTVNAERLRKEVEYEAGIEIEGLSVTPSDDATRNERHLAEGSTPPADVGPASSADKAAMMLGLARYQTIDELGEGAMGSVVMARDKVLDRLVAVKVMTRELDAHPGARDLFLTEAKALAALNHPNIVTVFDQGNDDGKLFIVMELVEGTTLEEKLEDGPLSAAEATDLGVQLSKALGYAHARRVIHRDIKPANIFLTDEGIAKIGDFGLARVVKEVMIKQTEIKGTPLYMAPEQIMGTNIDFRADIYSLGCTLFEVVSGRPPFIEGEILYHHLHTEPPRVSQYIDVPKEFDDIVFRCLQKNASDRFESADTLRQALLGNEA